MLKLISENTTNQVENYEGDIYDLRLKVKYRLQEKIGYNRFNYYTEKTLEQLKRVRQPKRIKQLLKLYFKLTVIYYSRPAKLQVVYSRPLTELELMRERLKRPNQFKINQEKNKTTNIKGLRK